MASPALSEHTQSLVPATRTRSELEEETASSSGSSADALSASHNGAAPLLLLLARLSLVTDISSACLDTERARKRQRTNSHLNASLPRSIIDHVRSPLRTTTTMRLTDSDQDSTFSVTPDFTAHAGPSTVSLDHSNGHTNGNGFVGPASPRCTTNGNGAYAVSSGSTAGNGVVKHAAAHGKAIAKVNLPGTTLYDDSYVDREEFVRLVIQSLRDVGYMCVLMFFDCVSGVLIGLL